MIYPIGQNLFWQKWLNLGEMTQIMSDQNFRPTKLFVRIKTWSKSLFSKYIDYFLCFLNLLPLILDLSLA